MVQSVAWYGMDGVTASGVVVFPGSLFPCNAYMLYTHYECQPAGLLPFVSPLHDEVMENKKNKKTLYTSMFSLLFTYFCLSLFLLLFVNHFSFVFCLICLPSANAFHPRVCRLQPLQPSGLQQPPAGRELRRLQQGNELMEGFGGGGAGGRRAAEENRGWV